MIGCLSINIYFVDCLPTRLSGSSLFGTHAYPMTRIHLDLKIASLNFRSVEQTYKIKT
jgi:hypothetical protein